MSKLAHSSDFMDSLPDVEDGGLPPDDFTDTLAAGVEEVLAQQARHLAALKEIVRNLGQLDPAAYDRIVTAHGLNPADLEIADDR